MTILSNTACIIVENYRVARINGFFEQQGYGPNNLCIPLINIDDPDDADPVAWAAESPVGTDILNLIKLATIYDGFYYKKTGRGQSIIDDFAAEHGYRRKP